MPSTFTAMPIEGVNFKERYVPSIDRPAAFQLGTPTIGNQNDTWVYVQADVPIVLGNTTVTVQTVTPGPTFYHITSAAGGIFAADTGFLAGEVGWVRLTNSPLDGPT